MGRASVFKSAACPTGQVEQQVASAFDVIKMVADHLEGLNALVARVDSLDRVFEMKYEDMVLYTRLVVDGVDAPWEVVADLTIVNDAYADVLRVLETVDQSIDHINAQVAMAELAKNTTEQIAITVENTRQQFVQWGEDIGEDFQTWLAQIEALRDAATAARDAAVAARTAAQNAQTAAEAAQTGAVDARNAAVASRDAAAGSAQTAAGHVSTAASHASAAAGHANSADAAANDAGTDAIQAAGSAVAANNSALTAQNHANTASTRKDEATAAANLARDWANKAPNQVVADGLYSARHWAEMAASVSTGAMMYMGGWSAASGSYPSDPQNGWVYKVTSDGTVQSVTYAVGDQIIYNGTGWDKIDNTDAVTSVAGRVGAVELTVSDIAGLGALALQSTVHWNDLSGVPNFSLSGHTHTKGDVGLSNVDNTSDMAKPVSTATATALAGKADATHSHSISDVTDLQPELDSLQTNIDEKAPYYHAHAIADVTGLQTALDGKQPAGSYAPASHTHSIANVSGLQSELDGKASASHTHSQSEVTNLVDDLAAKASRENPTFGGGYMRIGTYGPTHTVSGGHFESYFSENMPAAGANWRLMARDGAGELVPLRLDVSGSVRSTVDMEVSGSDVGFRSMPTTGRQVKFGSNNSNNSGIYSLTDASWMLRWNTNMQAYMQCTVMELGDTSGVGIILHPDGKMYRSNANSRTTRTSVPRVFVQSADPGAAAATGDLWIW